MYTHISQPKLKEMAAKEIADVAPLLNETDRGQLLLKRIIQMAHDEQNEENKIVAA
jgi:serine/threonine-protein phosphatase 4 regulatory subunit 1